MNKNGLIFIMIFVFVSLMFTLTSCIDSHKHTYSDEYSYNDVNHWNAATCEHTLKRDNREAHTFTDWTVISEYSCEQDGLKERTCTVCGYVQKQERNSKGHAWRKPVFTWTDFTATATFTCNNDETHIETINAVISSEVTIDPTCTATGVKTYTATISFNNKTYTDSKEEVLDIVDHKFTEEIVDATTLKDEATCTTKATYWYGCTECEAISDTLYFEDGTELGHDWKTPVFTWTDFTATAEFVCQTNSLHTDVLNATMTSEITKPATCTEEGVKTYTATVEFEGNTYTDTKEEVLEIIDHNYIKELVNAETLKTIADCTTKATYWYSCELCDKKSDTLFFEYGEIDSTNHNWAQPSFTWTEFVATAEFVCQTNSLHADVLNAIMTSEITKPATCTEEGVKTYTATVEFEGNTYTDTKEEVLEIIDHNFVDGKCTECQEEQPAYIRVDKDNNENVNGEYVLFGSYPQSSVTDATLNETLTTLAGTLPTELDSQNWTSYGYQISQVKTDYMWYQDIVYENEKYRGVYFVNYRSYNISYSTEQTYSYQDDNGYTVGNVYWFKFEPIRWKILTEKNGTAFLLADSVIDTQPYQENYVRTGDASNYTYFATDANGNVLKDGNGNDVYANNYEYSTIRKWLNEEFYNLAFNSVQKGIIQTTLLDNSVNSTRHNPNSYTCNDTNDKVFLLSYKDIINTEYGFEENDTVYSGARRRKGTDYAKCQGITVGKAIPGIGFTGWILRSPLSTSAEFSVVSMHGHELSGYSYEIDDAIVPALWIAL